MCRLEWKKIGKGCLSLTHPRIRFYPTGMIRGWGAGGGNYQEVGNFQIHPTHLPALGGQEVSYSVVAELPGAAEVINYSALKISSTILLLELTYLCF